MKFISKPVTCLLVVSMIFLLSDTLFAQPPEGIEWVERAYDYASAWCWDVNPDYGEFYNDCAHFQCQIANGGCLGLCEVNNTNNDPNHPEDEWTDLGNCPLYYWDDYPWPEDCEYSPSQNHLVIPLVRHLGSWFYENSYSFPVYATYIYYIQDVPYWVGPGCFAIALYIVNGDSTWHSIFIGTGYGRYSGYYAHTSSRDNEPLSTMFNTLGFDHIDFYQPAPSPAMMWSILSADNASQTNAECEGDQE